MSVKSVKIGGVELENNVFLAPMAGVCDHTFRLICKNYGAGLVYSEMISAKALSFDDKKTKALTKHDGEGKIAMQIFGHEPQCLADAAKRMEQEFGADIVDINMGCPAPKIVNNGDGSALLKNPRLCGEITEKVKNAVKIPVTVKIRSGFDSVNAPEVAKILELSGADGIAVHGRTRVQQYSGHADWSVIADVVKTVKIPVIANGDVSSKADFDEIMNETGAAAVMIGRGAFGNPWVFAEILGNSDEITPEMRIDAALFHTKMLIENKGRHTGILEARKHVSRYIKGMRGGAAARNLINSAESYEEMEKILKGGCKND